ncbi:hypothetical protein HID58_085672 [Brassica napus]|uniref:Uncharacterized protein n=1 Tax=Brassica napus TaxID=3708 RepID=A0ABQ7XQR8_BRANA|nr:hypothetical protein HID58_085672 [Brassica napus]
MTQVQSKEETPAKARLSREEKGKAKVVDDKPCASSASSSRVQDQRSQRDILSQSKCHDKTQSKTSTVGVFNGKAKVVDDKPCASSASSSRVQDQRSQRDILSQSKCHDKTQSKTSTVGVFNMTQIITPSAQFSLGQRKAFSSIGKRATESLPYRWTTHGIASGIGADSVLAASCTRE